MRHDPERKIFGPAPRARNLGAPDAPRPEPWRLRLRRFRARARTSIWFIAGVLAALLGFLLYDLFVSDPPALTLREVNDSVAQALASATPQPAFSARVYRAIAPSLVYIRMETPGAHAERDYGIGTGVVVNQIGDILTSLHVVADASEIRVTFTDGTESSAQVIVEQPENDIAVLRADRPPALLVPALLGNPNAMRVGDEAFVVGHPLGLVGSMSAGVISGLNRSFQPVDSEHVLGGLIQVDAAVNPGNSGGPLLNRDGHVVGIVTALVNPTDQDVFIGIGFAVPINVAGAAVDLPPY